MFRIFVINFGGTSGELSIYEDASLVEKIDLPYTKEELEMRYTGEQEVAVKSRRIMQLLTDRGYVVDNFDAFAVRGSGLFFGGEGGTFLVEGKLRAHMNEMYDPKKKILHASYVAIPVVDELLIDCKKEIPIYITDPSTIDQLLPEVKVTGNPMFQKRSAFHALNHRAVARKAAFDLGKKYDEVNLIVVHAGGGISIGAHKKGRIIDVNDATGDADGPFTPNRAGSLPTGQLVHMCYSGQFTEKEMFRKLKGDAGMKAYLGTEDMREVERRIDAGDEEAELIFKALAYQIYREIGACAATLCGEVDAIAFTAGLANSSRLIEAVGEHVRHFAPVMCYPGGFENEALALGAYRILSGQEELAVYDGEGDYLQNINPN
ncbi:butyrate kinase [Fusibacter paucivorans]|uniref:Probable butyrate kinase n=1 Tax=Fusibacter paucivorans TaxID=76009 RepID=A0ABS5PRY6_9FIRM|nr:butyrate kinase [Fusibacter paucivorans]MBS7527934.1 butyrate kinase [Fusibacter paucivorans]